MNVDLLSTIRLLHRVLGFLAQQPVEHLVDIADGRRRLLLSDPSIPADPADAPPTRAPNLRSLPTAVSRGSSGGQAGSSGKVTGTDADYAEVVRKLRSLNDVNEGVAYLAALRPGGRKLLKADLLVLCAVADLEIAPKTSNADLERKLLEHTIAAKKKYAGLSRW